MVCQLPEAVAVGRAVVASGWTHGGGGLQPTACTKLETDFTLVKIPNLPILFPYHPSHSLIICWITYEYKVTTSTPP